MILQFLMVFGGIQASLTTMDIRLTLKKLRSFYGRNYSGKTCISRIMRALETRQIPEKYDNPTEDELNLVSVFIIKI